MKNNGKNKKQVKNEKTRAVKEKYWKAWENFLEQRALRYSVFFCVIHFYKCFFSYFFLKRNSKENEKKNCAKK